jgi:hypothetical protein
MDKTEFEKLCKGRIFIMLLKGLIAIEFLRKNPLIGSVTQKHFSKCISYNFNDRKKNNMFKFKQRLYSINVQILQFMRYLSTFINQQFTIYISGLLVLSKQFIRLCKPCHSTFLSKYFRFSSENCTLDSQIFCLLKANFQHHCANFEVPGS